jgi:hypothetical protein
VAVRKISISLDEDLHADVAREAEAEGLSVSAFLAALAEDRIALLGLRRLVDEYEAEHGAFTDEEKAEAQAKLDAAGVPDHRLRPRLPEDVA